ncbi:hypothetical protein TVAG_086170 [Trichomonas vaginalis G3]|uniref:Uncharacterized protein n=1 Tax=Trichomonas vaginalis (strain ATCC PRA-98 / G3) TaxID=412133 RepID=A2FDC7_TRIV3|nr:armadillo (ARM) repeat-containing protein family [Trichomonas vaginalis G3]EAX97078.1 hypothetical protein TVAG_086170 [Trichomonas vaginalis G3]KAI5518763.1 armadillo (ARM) repeat-containing protein family [Trichomonas vaginalis G3]|eukprot:XP_001310008.1 hypothetical protein [Trichomonas vaginalis G3]
MNSDEFKEYALTACYSTDNEQRSQAEAQFNQIFQNFPQESIVELLNLIQSSNERLKNTGAVLLHRMILNYQALNEIVTQDFFDNTVSSVLFPIYLSGNIDQITRDNIADIAVECTSKYKLEPKCVELFIQGTESPNNDVQCMSIKYLTTCCSYKFIHPQECEEFFNNLIDTTISNQNTTQDTHVKLTNLIFVISNDIDMESRNNYIFELLSYLDENSLVQLLSVMKSTLTTTFKMMRSRIIDYLQYFCDLVKSNTKSEKVVKFTLLLLSDIVHLYGADLLHTFKSLLEEFLVPYCYEVVNEYDPCLSENEDDSLFDYAATVINEIINFHVIEIITNFGDFLFNQNKQDFSDMNYVKTALTICLFTANAFSGYYQILDIILENELLVISLMSEDASLRLIAAKVFWSLIDSDKSLYFDEVKTKEFVYFVLERIQNETEYLIIFSLLNGIQIYDNDNSQFLEETFDQQLELRQKLNEHIKAVIDDSDYQYMSNQLLSVLIRLYTTFIKFDFVKMSSFVEEIFQTCLQLIVDDSYTSDVISNSFYCLMEIIMKVDNDSFVDTFIDTFSHIDISNISFDLWTTINDCFVRISKKHKEKIQNLILILLNRNCEFLKQPFYTQNFAETTPIDELQSFTLYLNPQSRTFIALKSDDFENILNCFDIFLKNFRYNLIPEEIYQNIVESVFSINYLFFFPAISSYASTIIGCVLQNIKEPEPCLVLFNRQMDSFPRSYSENFQMALHQFLISCQYLSNLLTFDESFVNKMNTISYFSSFFTYSMYNNSYYSSKILSSEQDNEINNIDGLLKNLNEIELLLYKIDKDKWIQKFNQGELYNFNTSQCINPVTLLAWSIFVLNTNENSDIFFEKLDIFMKDSSISYFVYTLIRNLLLNDETPFYLNILEFFNENRERLTNEGRTLLVHIIQMQINKNNLIPEFVQFFKDSVLSMIGDHDYESKKPSDNLSLVYAFYLFIEDSPPLEIVQFIFEYSKQLVHDNSEPSNKLREQIQKFVK